MDEVPFQPHQSSRKQPGAQFSISEARGCVFVFLTTAAIGSDREGSAQVMEEMAFDTAYSAISVAAMTGSNTMLAEESRVKTSESPKPQALLTSPQASGSRVSYDGLMNAIMLSHGFGTAKVYVYVWMLVSMYLGRCVSICTYI